MNGRELQEYTTKYLLRDNSAPPRWPAKLLLQLLNEAQEVFVRETHWGLGSARLDLIAAEGEDEVILPESVVMVHSVRVVGDQRPLPCRDNDLIPYTDGTGKPYVYSTSEDDGKLRLYPVPDADYVLVTRAAVLPGEFSASDRPAIPLRFHTQLCYYAAMKALRHNEVDGENVVQAAEYERMWGRALVEAKREAYRQRTGPRAVARPPVSFTGKRN